jgi:hypothetical protein
MRFKPLPEDATDWEVRQRAIEVRARDAAVVKKIGSLILLVFGVVLAISTFLVSLYALVRFIKWAWLQ